MNRIVSNIKQGLWDLVYIWQKEMQVIFKDEGVLIFCILIPLLYPVLYTLIYQTEVMKEVPVVVIDQSQSSLSREFIRRVDASQWVKIEGLCTDEEEARKRISRNEVFGFLLIPEDFSTNIHQGRQAYIGAYSDMGGLLYYKGILIGATDASLEMNKNIKISRSNPMTEREEELTTYPVSNVEVAQFNPTMGFASFLIPAVLMLIIQQTLLLGIGMAGGTAVENRRYGDLLTISSHRRGILHVICGRSLAYFMIYLITIAYMVCVVPRIFNIAQLPVPYDMALFLLPYLIACIFFAMTLSVLLRNREISILVFVITSVPLLFLSGVSWPAVSIPPALKAISYLFPSTFGISGFVRINTMGATLEQVEPEYLSLWLQAFIYFLLTYLTIWVQVRREKKDFSL